MRRINLRRPTAYIEAVFAGSELTAEAETLTREERMGETVMLGLRLAEGVDRQAFMDQFGTTLESQWPNEIPSLVQKGLLEQTPKFLRLAEPRGLFLASEVMIRFL